MEDEAGKMCRGLARVRLALEYAKKITHGPGALLEDGVREMCTRLSGELNLHFNAAKN